MGQGKELIQRWWKLFNAGDLDGAVALMAPDASFVGPGAQLRGSEMRPFLAGWAEAFPDLRTETVSVTESDGQVVHEVQITGTHTGTMRTPQGDIPPTGKRVVWHAAEYARFAGGKFTHWHAFWDRASFMQQLGLAK
jgi:steroid delta-isomerase-like uncharacterized protein